jgi:hypothetical protein
MLAYTALALVLTGRHDCIRPLEASQAADVPTAWRFG